MAESDRRGRDPVTAGLAWLARRELSSHQLRTKLLRQGFDAATVEEALTRLQERGALDDRRAALSLARTAARVRRRGRGRVLRDVEALGIDRAIAAEAVEVAFADIDEEALLAAAYEQRRYGSLTDVRQLRRAYAHLLRQGFPPDRIRAFLRRRGASLIDA